jgi:DNA end-binding protein Ku
MPRSIWTGAISFGLVNVPVKVYSATSPKTVRFHQLDKKTGSRISQRRVNPQTGEEVPYEDLVKGFELTKDRYVVIEPAELDAISPEKSRTIDIEDFVELRQIDPVYYDHAYWLVPDKGAAKAYALLVKAMQESGKVAVARVVLRNKEHLVALRPSGDALMMETMLFHDEVVPSDELDELDAAREQEAGEREVAMARQLIDSLSTEFDPTGYRDEYREKVLELIERKADGETIVIEQAPAEPARVPDLMAALEASLAAVQDRSENGDAPVPDEAPAEKKPAKRAPAKKTPAEPRSKSKA